MNTLLVYDSVFGNTEKVAQAIGRAIAAADTQGHIETRRVAGVTAAQLRSLDLLIVGSPTRGFRPTEAISSLLAALPEGHLAGIRVASFDTRIPLDTIGFFLFRIIVDRGGYAAPKIASALKKAGGDLVVPPEGFFVTATEGPLKDGELERAEAWARQVLSRAPKA
jgi:flavodoxin